LYEHDIGTVLACWSSARGAYPGLHRLPPELPVPRSSFCPFPSFSSPVGCVSQRVERRSLPANFPCHALDLQLMGGVNRPLQVSQPGQLSLSSFRCR